MPGSLLELVACCAIIVFLLIAIFRGGASNPVGTGQLQRQLNTIGGEVRSLKTKVDGCALTSELELLRGDFRAMEGRVASSAELVALQGQLASLRAEMTGISAIGSRTETMVNLIHNHFVAKGINSQ